jgi:hypothetical protein
VPETDVDPRPPRRTLKEWSLVVQTNLDAIKRLIADKYDRGDRSVYSALGQDFPRVDITYEDLMESPVELADDVPNAQQLSEEMQRRSFG